MEPVSDLRPPDATEMAEERAAAVFKALADPLRLRLVAVVNASADGTACFCDIADNFDMPQSSLSHHLRVLVTAGVLDRERRGTWSWYTLRTEPFELLQDVLRPGGPLLLRSETCDEDSTVDQERAS